MPRLPRARLLGLVLRKLLILGALIVLLGQSCEGLRHPILQYRHSFRLKREVFQLYANMEDVSAINVALEISYDGGRYHGFSDENSEVRTVASTLRKQLSKIHSGAAIDLQGASRTDKGVHALGQVVNYVAPAAPFNGDYQRMRFALNRMLPDDLRIHHVHLADPSFHASTSSVGKRYRYTVDMQQLKDPLLRYYAWHVPPPSSVASSQTCWLNLDDMRNAASFLIDKHDFSAFANAPRGSARKAMDAKKSSANVCNLWKLDIEEVRPGVLQVTVEGDRFLYKMVRRIVGALVRVGQGRVTSEDLRHALQSGSVPVEALTFCAPAEGLVLDKIFYSLHRSEAVTNGVV